MTTTEPNPHVPVPGEAVGELPAREAHAQVRARTREAEPAGTMRLAWIQRAAPGLVSGSALPHAQPPSLAAIWAKHVASAQYFEAGLLRWPRYCWGAFGWTVAAVLYLVAWVVQSIPLLILTAGCIVAGIWLL